MKSLMLLTVFIFAGCKTSNSNEPYLIVSGEKLSLEIAHKNEQRQKGLMYRNKLKKNHGMLFIFENVQTLSFWMKNTKIPLSIAYIDSKCTIVDIQKMNPPLKNVHLKSYTSKKPALLALEVNQGWFETKNINVGDHITLYAKDFNLCN